MAKVLLNCLDILGKSMAGPAIRYWELAKILSKNHDVTLFTPNRADIVSDSFKIISKEDQPLSALLKDTDVIISQKIPPKLAWEIKKNGTKTILDAYDPEPLEHLEIFKFDPKTRQTKHKWHLSDFLFSFHVADRIICANTKQKDLWLGILLAFKKITPEIYDLDCSLNSLIGIVPFGLSSTLPQKRNTSLRKMFHLNDDDFVLIWGGGIYNWFDPLTLIRAIKEIGRPNVKLVFMGTKHPNSNVPEMQMTQDALDLAARLGLLDKQVFFNFGWTPYEERAGFLLEANAGVSNHFKHLETQFAFRTRILDYLWAELPIITTTGDSFAEMVETHKLGLVVTYEDSQAVAEAIKKLMDNADLIKTFKRNISQIRQQFFWERAAEPIEAMIQQLSQLPSQKFSFKDRFKIIALGVSNYKFSLLCKYICFKMAKKIGLKLEKL